ncbi:hypothetical protein DFS34DRAFT_21644 [Phlyctochytrium arcticum]|nr:hypothetical protein DFS34DRAFT_21644 [Phlyctochytrium arcticum]
MTTTLPLGQNPLSWSCATCNAQNEVKSVVCRICNLPPPKPGMWTCEHCSYFNSDQLLACDVCYMSRTMVKDLPFLWEWAPNPDQWISYDLPTASAIEETYQKGQACVMHLTHGPYFSRRPLQYGLKMDPAHQSFWQFNTMTGRPRRVRRWAVDDVTVAVRAEEVEAGDQCVICQESVTSQTDMKHARKAKDGKRLMTDDSLSTRASPSDTDSSVPESEECDLDQNESAIDSLTDSESTELSSISCSEDESGGDSDDESIFDAECESDDDEDWVFNAINTIRTLAQKPSTTTTSTGTSKYALTPEKISEMGDKVVRLRGCRGHYFHQGCIVPYVRLRKACPVCFTSVRVVN